MACWILLGFAGFFQSNAGKLFGIMPSPLLGTYFPVRCSVIIKGVLCHIDPIVADKSVV
jgi:hypothetical protein